MNDKTIEFYRKETGMTLECEDYFVMNGDEVWCDNYKTYESQEAVIGFEECVTKREDIGWRIADK